MNYAYKLCIYTRQAPILMLNFVLATYTSGRLRYLCFLVGRADPGTILASAALMFLVQAFFYLAYHFSNPAACVRQPSSGATPSNPMPRVGSQLATADGAVSTAEARIAMDDVGEEEVQRALEVPAGGVLVDMFADLFAVIAVTLQLVAAPTYAVWPVYQEPLGQLPKSWTSARALASAAVQLPVLLLGYCVVLVVQRQRLPAYQAVFSREFVGAGAVFMWVHCLGLMMHHSFTFWPFGCLSCDRPVDCLTFLECLRDGEVMLDGMCPGLVGGGGMGVWVDVGVCGWVDGSIDLSLYRHR